MKKCKDCDREIDKYAIACQYCGKLLKEEDKSKAEEEDLGREPDKHQKHNH